MLGGSSGVNISNQAPLAPVLLLPPLPLPPPPPLLLRSLLLLLLQLLLLQQLLLMQLLLPLPPPEGDEGTWMSEAVSHRFYALLRADLMRRFFESPPSCKCEAEVSRSQNPHPTCTRLASGCCWPEMPKMM